MTADVDYGWTADAEQAFAERALAAAAHARAQTEAVRAETERLAAQGQLDDARRAAEIADLEHRARVRRLLALDAPTIPIPAIAPNGDGSGTADTGAGEPGTEVEDMNRDELREECRRRGVSQRGTTADLRARLTGTEPGTRAEEPVTPGTAVPG